MLRQLKHKIGTNLINMQGWSTKRKFVVFESDDWGTVRMPDVNSREYLCSKFPLNFNAATYDRVDNLANADDLSALFEILMKYRDSKGNHPVITANTIVCNPDFDKIRESNYAEYYFEPFTDTLDKYPTHEGTFKLWNQGMKEGVFHPQLHGREHLNVLYWMHLLQQGEKSSIEAFNHGTWVMKSDEGGRLDIAFDFKDENDIKFAEAYLRDSAVLFKEIFGYKSKSYIAPSYTWNDNIERLLNSLDIKVLQGGLYQKHPKCDIEKGEKRLIKHHMGERNNTGQVYLMRNTHFEPTLINNVDLVEKCLGDIKRSFRWGKPAIVSVHRLNFIGNLEESNRKKTLLLLDNLLKKIVEKYPDVEFVSSDVLGCIMLSDL